MIYEGLQYTQTVTLETVICYKCGVPFGMPSYLKASFQRSKESFYCPNGHPQAYVESEADRLRKLLQQKDNQLAQKSTANIQLENELNKANKKLKRVQRGVCPCCNRTFDNLARHMESKHPEVKKQPK